MTDKHTRRQIDGKTDIERAGRKKKADRHRQIRRETNKDSDRQTDRQMNSQTDRETHRQMGKDIKRQINEKRRNAGRQGKEDRQMDRQTD